MVRTGTLACFALGLLTLTLSACGTSRLEPATGSPFAAIGSPADLPRGIASASPVIEGCDFSSELPNAGAQPDAARAAFAPTEAGLAFAMYRYDLAGATGG